MREKNMHGGVIWAKSRRLKWILLTTAAVYVTCFYGWNVGVPVLSFNGETSLWIRPTNVLPAALGIFSVVMVTSPMSWIDRASSKTVMRFDMVAYVVVGALVAGAVLLPIGVLSILPRRFVPNIDDMDSTGSAAFVEVISGYRFSVYVIPAIFFLSCSIVAVAALGKLFGLIFASVIYILNIAVTTIPSISAYSPLFLNGRSDIGVIRAWAIFTGFMYICAIVFCWLWKNFGLIIEIRK
ncbi:hypothetical protein JS532_10840 [Bifidobacterium callimiconis]|uniref:hypothetical protein n=1 Tax=Bifidobacterium callimiconis TaxID=2306973 RepID=UPI001BDD6B01|nr:hypothetical protein [Bifidobacterium callimiconis]MBT1178038.1 hypothetical protein [Bifidobacterium callimiconis]